jgi:hypothetical protein
MKQMVKCLFLCCSVCGTYMYSADAVKRMVRMLKKPAWHNTAYALLFMDPEAKVDTTNHEESSDSFLNAPIAQAPMNTTSLNDEDFKIKL